MVIHISKSSSRQLINSDEIFPSEERERSSGDGNGDAPEIRDVAIEYVVELVKRNQR